MKRIILALTATFAALVLTVPAEAQNALLQNPIPAQPFYFFTNTIASASTQTNSFGASGSRLGSIITPYTQTGNAAYQPRLLAWQFQYWAAAAGTSNLTFRFNTSLDGTTYTTDLPLRYTVALNGTNRITTCLTNMLPITNSVPFMRLDSIVSDQTNAVTVTNSVWKVLP